MNSGIRHIDIVDPGRAASFPAIVQYPTDASSAGASIGPYHFDATLDAPITTGTFPLCVVSHGGGGSHLLYRTIATYLASHGFIVVSPEHPGDNRNDRSESNTDRAVMQRPRHASLALDAVLQDEFFSTVADRTRISAIGHSMGGYTALAMAGGRPWSRSRHPIAVTADHRVRAAVLMAPSTDWFLAPDSLTNVTVPLLVLAGEWDHITPPSAIRHAMNGLPARTPFTFHVVPGAGHYSFLAPFPTHMQRPDFPPSTDPEGFDRDAFHEKLPRMIHEFLVEFS